LSRAVSQTVCCPLPACVHTSHCSVKDLCSRTTQLRTHELASPTSPTSTFNSAHVVCAKCQLAYHRRWLSAGTPTGTKAVQWRATARHMRLKCKPLLVQCRCCCLGALVWTTPSNRSRVPAPVAGALCRQQHVSAQAPALHAPPQHTAPVRLRVMELRRHHTSASPAATDTPVRPRARERAGDWPFHRPPPSACTRVHTPGRARCGRRPPHMPAKHHEVHYCLHGAGCQRVRHAPAAARRTRRGRRPLRPPAGAAYMVPVMSASAMRQPPSGVRDVAGAPRQPTN